eukprot:4510452-Pleurochrysis_carterae.AAC.1
MGTRARNNAAQTSWEQEGVGSDRYHRHSSYASIFSSRTQLACVCSPDEIPWRVRLWQIGLCPKRRYPQLTARPQLTAHRQQRRARVLSASCSRERGGPRAPGAVTRVKVQSSAPLSVASASAHSEYLHAKTANELQRRQARCAREREATPAVKARSSSTAK